MSKSANKSCWLCFSLCVVASGTSYSQASLVGDSVDIRLNGPNYPIVSDTVIAGGPEPNFIGMGLGAAGNVPRWDIDIEPSPSSPDNAIVRIGFIGPASYGHGLSIRLEDLDWVGTPGFVSGVNLLGEQPPSGFSLSQPNMLSFGPDWVSAQIAPNNGVITWDHESYIEFEIQAEHVPEPKAGILASIGLLASLAMRRRL